MKRQYISPEVESIETKEDIMNITVNSGANAVSADLGQGKESGSVDWGEDE